MRPSALLTQTRSAWSQVMKMRSPTTIGVDALPELAKTNGLRTLQRILVQSKPLLGVETDAHQPPISSWTVTLKSRRFHPLTRLMGPAAVMRLPLTCATAPKFSWPLTSDGE